MGGIPSRSGEANGQRRAGGGLPRGPLLAAAELRVNPKNLLRRPARAGGAPASGGDVRARQDRGRVRRRGAADHGGAEPHHGEGSGHDVGAAPGDIPPAPLVACTIIHFCGQAIAETKARGLELTLALEDTMDTTAPSGCTSRAASRPQHVRADSRGRHRLPEHHGAGCESQASRRVRHVRFVGSDSQVPTRRPRSPRRPRHGATTAHDQGQEESVTQVWGWVSSYQVSLVQFVRILLNSPDV